MKAGGWAKALTGAGLAALAAGCEFELFVSSRSDTDPHVETSDWWRCPERLEGEWTFGRAPHGCDVEAFGSATVVRTDFRAYIFDDEQPRDEERVRYMGELYAFLTDEAAGYIRTRRPEVSAPEVAAWQHAIHATAHQEAFWTHYREAAVAGARWLTMIRGDLGHGHGLMQIDDRYHSGAIEGGIGWRLDENLIYGLDIYYAGWQQAPEQWCVASADDWTARARSAYSAYNGGPAQICRWTDPAHPWARNDVGFYEKYTRMEWLGYVAP